MRVVIQRVSHAHVEVDGKREASIQQGLMVLLGIEQNDTEEDAKMLSKKMVHLRIFEDEEGKMNRSLLDLKGQLLLVSQFTLCANTKKGRRPSFVKAMHPSKAEPLYLWTAEHLREFELEVQTGVFGADMQVTLCNDGPVTMILESQN